MATNSSSSSTSSAVISTDQLFSRLGSAKVIDATWFPSSARNPKAEWRKIRISGAEFFDLEEFSDQNTKLPNMLPPEDQFSRQIGELGISNDDFVVVYDTASNYIASARLWLTFRIFGHNNVAVLDGGLPKWISEGKPTEIDIEPNPPKPQKFVAKLQAELVASLAQVSDNVEKKEFSLVDARPPGRFEGTDPEPQAHEPIPSGHIPGAVNVPFTTLLSPEVPISASPSPTASFRTFQSPEKIREVFEKKGVSLENKFISSCGSGISASVLVLGLYQCGKARDVLLFDGSWAQWATDPSTSKRIVSKSSQ